MQNSVPRGPGLVTTALKSGEMFTHNAQLYVKLKTNSQLAQTPHGGLMLWACRAAKGPEHLAVMESTTNFSVDQSQT